jgi:Tfp pilus assembly protein PilP
MAVVAALAMPRTARAQPPSQEAAQTPPPPVSTDVYTYQADGRRDPFVNLLNVGGDAHPTAKRGEGAAGLSLGEISVRGVMQSRGAMVAMIQGPDKKTYLVHPGDKLLDATIKTINQQGLIVSQEVNDPLSIVKQREVRKLLRSLEGGKE